MGKSVHVRDGVICERSLLAASTEIMAKVISSRKAHWSFEEREVMK